MNQPSVIPYVVSFPSNTCINHGCWRELLKQVDTAWWKMPRRWLFHMCLTSNQATASPKWTVPAARGSENCSDHRKIMLLALNPILWIQESKKPKRNRGALCVCMYFIGGYNEPLMQQDSLGGSDVLCPFWWAHKGVAWCKGSKEALSWGNDSSKKETTAPGKGEWRSCPALLCWDQPATASHSWQFYFRE